MTIYERRKQHLDSRLKVYLDDPKQRATDDSGSGPRCLYRAEDGRKCFIGQDLPDDKYSPDLEGKRARRLMELLPPEVRELGEDFLSDSQVLHDDNSYWDATGLTGFGQMYYNDLVTNYCTAP